LLLSFLVIFTYYSLTPTFIAIMSRKPGSERP
jgi:hypothetical protein